MLGCFIVRGPFKWGLVVLTLLSLLLALGRNCEWLSDLFINYFPLYNKFRTVESILVIAEFTIPLLAMMGLHRLITASPDQRRTMLRPMLISFGICAAVCALGAMSPSIFGSFIGAGEQEYVTQGYLTQYPSLFAAVETLRMGMVRADSLRSLFIILIGGCAIWMYIRQKAHAGVMIAVVGVVILVDLYTVGKRYVDHDSFCSPQLSAAPPFQPTVADSKIMADTTANFKVMNIPQFMQPAPSYFYKNLGGYHAAKLTRYQDMIERHLIRVAKVGYHPELRNDSLALTLTGGDHEMMQALQSDLKVLDMLNARYIVVSSDSIVRNTHALGQAWLVDKIAFVDGADAEMAALDTLDPATEAVADAQFRDILDNPGTLAPGDTIIATSYAPNRLTYTFSTANGALAVFPEIYFPWGWNATIDDESVNVGRVNYLLRAIRLPAGSHTLTMEFNPSSLRITNTIAIIAIVLVYTIVAAAIISTIRRREKENN
ncbi:MAG: YfhO family protein [Muribaculaceae bacterium]|nr:YfhO family protein [Muribaculaceae bacterium]